MNQSESPITLEILNREEIIERIPTTVYLSLVMFMGIFGNTLVILIYFGSLWKLEGAHWTFIRTISIVDFLICTVVIPFEFYQQTHQLIFYNESACKILRMISVHLSVMASLLLVMMSANRLYRVVWPLKVPFSSRQALFSVIIVGLAITAVSWPEGKLSGINLKKLRNNITGYDCDLADSYKHTIYIVVYSIVLLVGFLACVTSLIMIYAFIGQKLRRRGHFKSTNSSQPPTDVSVESSLGSVEVENESYVSSNRNVEQKLKSKHFGTKSTHKQRKTTKSNRESIKVTKIAFVISIAFILSYLPYLAVKLTAALSNGQHTANSFVTSIFSILSRFFLINNIINPFVYVCLDQTFRRQCKRLLLCTHIRKLH
ncbi:CCKAR [Mytilus coruscus]|uniref:CCKAR n=1 Tax=Mytilus coruscus TaxID=42192 RepID=A0A6J8BQ46_MYTCO|nr:CCKAR [Mytilus coruscus]